MENKVLVEVFYSGRNFSAHVPVLPGCVATGQTPAELKKNIKEAIAFHIEGSLADGDYIPDVFLSDYELIYKFDTEGLLNYYKEIFTKPALQKLTGINEKQLHHYASGLRKPRKTQIVKIENALHELGRELIEVRL